MLKMERICPMIENKPKPSPAATTVKNVAEWPAWPPPPRPRPPQGPSRAIKILTITLAALLVLGGLGFIIYAATGQYGQALNTQRAWSVNATVRSQVYHQATVVGAIIGTAQPLATIQAQIVSTATAQAQATQNAGEQNDPMATTTANLLTKDTTGTPEINDPLTDNSQDHEWDKGYTDNNGSGCNFINSTYQVQEALYGFLNPCFAEATSFSNFVYQISMTITSGNEGGIIFRADKDTGQYYLFRIDISGAYALDLYNKTSYAMLSSGISPAIEPGLNQSNDLTVIANKSTLDLFVNQNFVASITNKTLSSGQIGVAALNSGLPGTVDFSDAEVWKIS
jgi:hypothetical protein